MFIRIIRINIQQNGIRLMILANIFDKIVFLCSWRRTYSRTLVYTDRSVLTDTDNRQIVLLVGILYSLQFLVARNPDSF